MRDAGGTLKEQRGDAAHAPAPYYSGLFEACGSVMAAHAWSIHIMDHLSSVPWSQLPSSTCDFFSTEGNMPSSVGYINDHMPSPMHVTRLMTKRLLDMVAQ